MKLSNLHCNCKRNQTCTIFMMQLQKVLMNRNAKVYHNKSFCQLITTKYCDKKLFGWNLNYIKQIFKTKSIKYLSFCCTFANTVEIKEKVLPVFFFQHIDQNPRHRTKSYRIQGIQPRFNFIYRMVIARITNYKDNLHCF